MDFVFLASVAFSRIFRRFFMKFESLRRHGKLTIFASIIGAFFCNQVLTLSQSSPKIYYVAKNGRDSNSGSINDPFLTIKQCVRVVAAGESCVVRGGNYNEHFINIGPGYTASGTSWSNPITLKSYPGESVVVGNLYEDSIMTFYGTNDLFWIVDGFVFDGSTGWRCCDSAGGLIGGSGRSVRIQNSEVKYGVSNGLDANGSNWELLNLNVHHNGTQLGRVQFHGIYWSGTGLLIDGGSYHDNKGYGVHIFSSGATTISNNTVRNIFAYGNAAPSGQTGSGGIILSAGSNNSAYNNVIFNNVENGLDIDYRCANCSAYNNTIYGNYNWGIQVGSNTSTTNTILRNNVVYGNLNSIKDRGTGTVASNNMTTNPLFVNASGGDFSLQAGSGAIGAGMNLSSIFTTDILGRPRSTSGAFDLGAYAYAPSSAPDFSVVASPTALAVTQGGAQTVTTTLTAYNGFNGAVSLSVTGCPSGATCSIVSPVSPNPTGTSALSITYQRWKPQPGRSR
jgi:parallel beta-helix repeat protein